MRPSRSKRLWDAIWDYVLKNGITSAAECESLGWSEHCLREMAKRGYLKKVGPGLYVHAHLEKPIAEWALELGKLRLTTTAWLCGPSAAYFFRLLPIDCLYPLWIGLNAGGRRPKGYDHCHVWWFSRSRGYDESTVANVYTQEPLWTRASAPERAVCELFAKRTVFGERMARVAMREYLKRPDANLPELLRVAQQFNVLGLLYSDSPLADDVRLTPDDISAYEQRLNRLKENSRR